jgi:NAD(P)H dehydrogenase (quinone)
MNHKVSIARRAFLGLSMLALGGGALAATAAPSGEKIIISGASGQLGLLTVKELLRRGLPAKNLILVSRTPEKLAEYVALGASARFGDVDMPASLPAAYAGGDRMLMISLGFAPGSAPRPPRHKVAFDAAVKAGVKHIVYTSFIGADQGGDMLTDDHKQSEEFLRASGAKWTALRNGIYADGQLQTALQMAATGKATARAGDPKDAPVTREDCAAAAAGALLGGSKFENQGFDITGPELVNTHDIARIVGEVIGRKIEVSESTGNAAARGASQGMTSAAPKVTDAVARLSGRPGATLRARLMASKSQLLAAAAGGN